MKLPNANLAFFLCACALAGTLCQATVAGAEPPSDEPPAAEPSDAEPGAAPPEKPAAPEAAPPKAPPPFTLGYSDAKRTGKSPFANATNLGRPPVVYVAPMEGDLGLDVGKEVYGKILADIREKKPDIVVFRLKSSDGTLKTSWIDGKRAEDRKRGRLKPAQLAGFLPDLADLALQIHGELRDVPCVMYVEDAIGASSMYALAWPYMFMAPQARIAGLDIMSEVRGAGDADVAAKFQKAKVSQVLGILLLGGRPAALGEALILSDKKLSVQFEGRSAVWRPDTEGDWSIVDSSEEMTAQFTSTDAENTGLSDGVAENLDDLMLLLGYPEFQKVDSGEQIFRDVNAAWRAKWKDSLEMVEKSQEEAGDEDLPGRKQLWEKMIQLTKQYPQLARYWKVFGLDEKQMKLIIDQINQRLRTSQKERQGQSSGGSGKGGSSGRGFGAR